MINPTNHVQISTGFTQRWINLSTIQHIKFNPAPSIHNITTVVTWCDGTESIFQGQPAGELFRQWCQFVN